MARWYRFLLPRTAPPDNLMALGSNMELFPNVNLGQSAELPRAPPCEDLIASERPRLVRMSSLLSDPG
jgi:hypothetical protein